MKFMFNGGQQSSPTPFSVLACELLRGSALENQEHPLAGQQLRAFKIRRTEGWSCAYAVALAGRRCQDHRSAVSRTDHERPGPTRTGVSPQDLSSLLAFEEVCIICRYTRWASLFG